MPELPEVEAARRAVHDHCLGKKIRRAIVADDPKVIDGVSSSNFEAALVGKSIVSAKRKGKNMWLELNSPPFPSFQFGMAGAVYIKGVAVTTYKRSAVKDTDEWPSKYSKVFIEVNLSAATLFHQKVLCLIVDHGPLLDDGLELCFTDKRRFARVRLLDNPALAPPISELGPDALLEPMTIDEFTEALSKRKIAIKTILLDQSFVAGIGNWIADEVLYQARIHPLEVASSLSKEKCAALLNSVKEVIEKAIEVRADSSQFPSDWIFHSRENNPGKAFVNGKKINFITAGGRTTAYVPELQKLSSATAAKAANGKSRQASKRKKSEDDDGDNVAVSADDQEEEPIDNGKTKKPQKPKGQVRKLAKNRGVQEDDVSDGVNSGGDKETDENGRGKNRKTKEAAKKTSRRTRGAGKGGKRKKQG